MKSILQWITEIDNQFYATVLELKHARWAQNIKHVLLRIQDNFSRKDVYIVHRGTFYFFYKKQSFKKILNSMDIIQAQRK